METGYLKVFCDVLLEELEKLPGDSRTHIGFLTYDRVVHFYSLPDGATQPTQLTVCDIDGKFKFIYPKYYKNPNKSCTFAAVGQIGPLWQY